MYAVEKLSHKGLVVYKVLIQFIWARTIANVSMLLDKNTEFTVYILILMADSVFLS